MQNDPNDNQPQGSPPELADAPAPPVSGSVQPATPGQQTDEQKVAAYYEQLRRGKHDFDSQTASALLMKLDMEAQQQARVQQDDRKKLSLMMALIFPWRMFDPATRPTNGTRMLIVIVFFFILIFVLPIIVLKFVHM